MVVEVVEEEFRAHRLNTKFHRITKREKLTTRKFKKNPLSFFLFYSFPPLGQRILVPLIVNDRSGFFTGRRDTVLPIMRTLPVFQQERPADLISVDAILQKTRLDLIGNLTHLLPSDDLLPDLPLMTVIKPHDLMHFRVIVGAPRSGWLNQLISKRGLSRRHLFLRGRRTTKDQQQQNQANNTAEFFPWFLFVSIRSKIYFQRWTE